MFNWVFLLIGLGLLVTAGILVVVVTASIRKNAARGRYSWWVLIFVPVPLLIMAMTVFYVPRQVDDVAYLAGAGRSVLFFPRSHADHCGGNGCVVMTNGVLATGESVSWPDAVPLGKPFPVRVPVWNAGTGRALITGASSAMINLLGLLLLDLITAFFIMVIHPAVRHMRRLRRGRANRQTPSAA